MGFRITTNMMMNSYRYNLQNSTKKLSDARDMVLTQRKFASYADDPAAATLAFRLRREYYQTNNYLNNTKDVYSKFNTAWNNLAGVVEDLSDATARVSSIRGNNGTAGESRTALAVVLRETAESVVHALNQKLGDHFVFAGNDALNVPFSWSDDGRLLYRGIDVNSGKVQKPTIKEPDWMDQLKSERAKLESNRLVKTTDKAWYDEVKDPTAGLTRTEEPSQAIKDVLRECADAAKNGTEPNDTEVEAWYDYYTTPGKTVPTAPTDKDGKLIVPDWLSEAEKVTEWDTAEDAQKWYKYYTGEDKKPDPGVDCPDAFNMDQWMEDMVNDPDKNPDGLTENELQGWYDYYVGDAEDPPLLDGYDTWGEVKEPDTYPADLPKSSAGLSGSELKWYNYYSGKRNVKLLEKMADEEMYIDLGMGAAESSPNSPVKGTYFNSALAGVDFIGYGIDKDGDPQNLAMIMKELADVFDNWHENGQKYVPDKYKDMSYTEFQDKMDNNPEFAAEINKFHDEYEAKAFRLMDKLKAAQEHTTEKWVELDANSVYLQTAEKQLTTQSSDLNLQVLDIEQVDLADAITTFSWQQYCYNSALKIGNQLLSQSLIDYMN